VENNGPVRYSSEVVPDMPSTVHHGCISARFQTHLISPCCRTHPPLRPLSAGAQASVLGTPRARGRRVRSDSSKSCERSMTGPRPPWRWPHGVVQHDHAVGHAVETTSALSRAPHRYVPCSRACDVLLHPHPRPPHRSRSPLTAALHLDWRTPGSSRAPSGARRTPGCGGEVAGSW